MLLTNRHVEPPRSSSLRAITSLLAMSALTAGGLLCQSADAAGQDPYTDQWNVWGGAEEQSARFESSVRPTRFDERLVSDNDEDFLPFGQQSATGRARFQSESDFAKLEPDEAFDAFESELRQTSPEALFDGQLAAEQSLLSDPAEPFNESPTADSISQQLNDGWVSGASHAPLSPDAVFRESQQSRTYGWHMLPQGLLYRSYLAGTKEPRMQFAPLRDYKNDETYWDAVLGGRVGVIRNGTAGAHDPHGFQLDLEGAVFARVLPNEPSAALASADFRGGVLATWREDRTAYKAGYYHISSHAGDEYLLLNPTFTRINYVRDSLVGGTVYDLNLDSRIYGEIAWALGTQGGAKPLELQFGAEYTPRARRRWGGAPYAAVNGHIREEFDFHTGFNVMSGWNWQNPENGQRLRFGLQYYNGPSLQYQFFDRWENLLGVGLWFDY